MRILAIIAFGVFSIGLIVITQIATNARIIQTVGIIKLMLQKHLSVIEFSRAYAKGKY